MYDAGNALKKNFNAVYCDIKAPEDLKRDTLRKMLEEEERLKHESAKLSKRKKHFLYCSTMAAALCIAVLGFAMLRPTGISYVTSMEEGVYYDEVELKNGVIRFIPERVSISMIPNAGQVGIEGKETIKNDLLQEKEEVMEQVDTETGGELMLLKADTVSLPENTEDGWSYIGDQKIYVSVLRSAEEKYHAIYDKDGSIYEVVGTNVSQKEFIEYLYLQIK